jgi:hypothetical protein
MHYLVLFRVPDNRYRVAFVGTTAAEARRAAASLRTLGRRVALCSRPLSTRAAAVAWFRLGKMGAEVPPPERYAYAYRLGQRMARLKSNG